jgi:hypothetical protein
MTDSDNEKRKPDARDRFEAVRGKADIEWRTDDLMAVLRGDDKILFDGQSSPRDPV